MRVNSKIVFRFFKNHLSRFIALTLIILIGNVFISGFGTLTYTIEESLSEEFTKYNGADLILKSKSVKGFTAEMIEEIKLDYRIKGIKEVTCLDMGDTRIIISNMDDNEINRFEITDGKKITEKNQILSDRLFPETNKNVELYNNKFEVVGTIKNPLIYAKGNEYNYDKEEIKHYYYLDSNFFDLAKVLPVTDLYIKLNFDHQCSIFSKDYQDTITKIKEEFEKKDDIVALTYNENTSYNLVTSYSQKINVLCIALPIFFLIVSCLVVLSTMTRLVYEERSIMGCYLSLGYPVFKIIIKYVIFSFVCCMVGSVFGMLIGIYGIPPLLYTAFSTTYFLPVMSKKRKLLLGILGFVIMLLLIIFITIYVSLQELKEKPCNLFKRKAPKIGKKLLIEKISFFWNKLSFKYKSTIRNVFRYKKNLLMTLISIAGSTAIVLAGFGLRDIAISDSSGIPSSMVASFKNISVVIILFAGMLSMLVVYNLTNMNISERKMEIATLKVLGYQNKEVGLYMYREIFIMTMLGIIVGLPMGYGLLCFLIDYIGFGTHHDIQFVSYIITIIIIFIFVVIVDLLLYYKIKKLDMNESLKINE